MAILSGTAGPDDIKGTPDDDQIKALDGNDHVSGGAGNDQLIGGAGNDFIGGAEGADTAYGGLDKDTIGGGAGRDLLFGEAGADTLHGEAGNDSLYGGSGDDNLLGGTDNDSLYGGPGQDLLSGGSGADNLYGSDGLDILSGGIGDNLYGEAGDDVLIWDSEQFVLSPFESGSPYSSVFGGAGYDTLRVNVDLLYYVNPTLEKGYQEGPYVSPINLHHGMYGDDDTGININPFIRLGIPSFGDLPVLEVNLEGIERIEVSGLSPLSYTNYAESTPSNITVVGTAQDDFLRGGYGDEVLIGGAGNDYIGGGIGQDSLFGGAGVDLFSYGFDPNLPPIDGEKADGLDGNDIILDFNVSERDVVQLVSPYGIDANGITSDANEILVTQTAENVVLTFGGNSATFQFDTLGINDISAIGGDTLQALEAKLIGLSGDSAYDPFQIV